MENLIKFNETDRPAASWDTFFDVGVEVIVGLPGKVSLYDQPETVTDPIKAAVVALHPSITELMTTITFAQTYEDVCHMTIKIATGNEATEEGSSLDQDVAKNLTSVMADAETSQVFLSAALNCAEPSAPSPCNPAEYAQKFYEASQIVPVAPVCSEPPPETGCPKAPDPAHYTDAEIPAAILKVPEVLASGTPQPNAGPITGPISMEKQLTFVFDLPVEPVVMCFPPPATTLSQAALLILALGSTGNSLFMFLLFGTWAIIALVLGYKAYKAGGCKQMLAACKGEADGDEGEGEDGDDDDDDDEDEEEEDEEGNEEEKLPEGEDGDDGKEDGGDEDGEINAGEINESDVNLEEFLNKMYTPGIDDSIEMTVNPVLVYVTGREKKEEKLRLEAQAAAEGDGEEEKKEEKKQDAAEPTDHKVSALKRLGWSLKSDVVVADVAKQLKEIDGHISKSKGIDTTKIAYKKGSRAGKASNDVILEVKLHFRDFEKLHGDHNKHYEAMGHAAEMARAQLRQMKLKTKVAEEEPEEEKAGEEGEEGEDGEKAAEE